MSVDKDEGVRDEKLWLRIDVEKGSIGMKR